ncbi:MAG: metallophosphoesterase family protein [Bdellovibrionota bacterium]
MNLIKVSAARKAVALVALSSTFVIAFAGCGGNYGAKKSDDPVIGKPIPGGPVDQPDISGRPAPPLGGPGYIRAMFNSDATNVVTIGFSEVGTPSQKIRVAYDTKDYGREIERYSMSSAPTASNVFKGLNNYFVELKNLKPDTTYYFMVENERAASLRYSFRTVSDKSNTRLSIVVGGDSRTNRKPRQLANLLVAKLRPHFVMFGGDMTSSGTNTEWKDWFTDWQLTIGKDGRITPAIFTRGNHESSNEILEKLFDTPKGVYYGVNAGGKDLLRVYTLNSESAIAGAQTDWLKADLSNHTGVKWKFAQYHRPIRPHTSGKGDLTLAYQHWAPLFHANKMTVVSESDAHTLKTTWPIRPSTVQGNDEGFVRDDIDGTVYIGEGCWGAPLRTNNDLKEWTRDSGRFNNFSWVFVDKSRVEIRTVKVDNAEAVGEVTDANPFELPSKIDIWAPVNGPVITIGKAQ